MIEHARKKWIRLFEAIVVEQKAAAKPLLGTGRRPRRICIAWRRGCGREGRIASVHTACGAFAPRVGRRARADAELDAVAVAIAILADALVIDAAPPLDRVAGVAPANVPAVRFPNATHDHSRTGKNG